MAKLKAFFQTAGKWLGFALYWIIVSPLVPFAILVEFVEWMDETKPVVLWVALAAKVGAFFGYTAPIDKHL